MLSVQAFGTSELLDGLEQFLADIFLLRCCSIDLFLQCHRLLGTGLSSQRRGQPSSAVNFTVETKLFENDFRANIFRAEVN